MLRAYVDASLGRFNAGIGYAILDHQNKIIYKRRLMIPPTESSNNLEYIGLLSLLKTIKEIGIKNVIVHTDCKNVCDQVSLVGSERKLDNKYVREIIYELSVNPTVKLKWTPREENNIAHELSRDSMRGKSDLEYIEPLLGIKNEVSSKVTMKTIRYKKNLFKQCPCCKELKAMTEFPRYRKYKGMKSCKTCRLNLDQIQFGYLKTKNTY